MSTVRVGPLPTWMPIPTLLGDHDWEIEATPAGVWAQSELQRPEAADILARLRGLAFGGLDLTVTVIPPLKRALVRAGRSRDAKARRSTTPGFERPGTRLDDEGKRSLTPESIALAMGQAAGGRHVLDLTCGAGGNAIGFARAGCRVTAVELDEGRLADAQHNAAKYGVQHKISFHHSDAREALSTVDADLVFMDPPWLGWDHRRTERTDLPLLDQLLGQMPQGQAWWAKVPPSFVAATVGDPVSVQPWFGRHSGDRHRVKCLLLRCEP